MLDTFPQGDAYAIHDEAIVPVGECVRDAQTGLLWSFMKARVALTEGQQLAPSLNLLNSGAALTSGSGKADTTELTFATQEHIDALVTAGIPKNSENKEYGEIIVNVADGIDQSGVITAIDGVKLTVRWDTDSGRLKTALAAASRFEVVAYWLAALGTTALPVIGVAQQDVAKDKFFWALCEGKGKVRTSATVVAGNALYVGNTAGSAIPQTAAETFPAFAYSLQDRMGAGVIQAKIKVPLVISQVPVGSAPYLSGDRRPDGTGVLYTRS